MNRNAFISLFLICLFALACDTSEVAPTVDLAFGRDYFPIVSGRFISYNVKETTYRLNQRPEVTTYQLKEVVGEQFVGANGDRLWRIIRYRRANGRQNWQVVGSHALRSDELFGIRWEENQSYVRLNFPLERGKRWDGNLFNNLGRDNYELTDLGRSYLFDGKRYTETATVLQNNDSSLVNKDKRIEVYAKGLGLIYRLADQVAYCQDRAQNCLGRAIIESGVVYEQSIFDSGVEVGQP
jgi:hypothetical protein